MPHFKIIRKNKLINTPLTDQIYNIITANLLKPYAPFAKSITETKSAIKIIIRNPTINENLPLFLEKYLTLSIKIIYPEIVINERICNGDSTVYTCPGRII